MKKETNKMDEVEIDFSAYQKMDSGVEEEDDEEIITIDFNNTLKPTFTSKWEDIKVIPPVVSSKPISLTSRRSEEVLEEPKLEESKNDYKEKLNNLFIDSLTSKAISSLISEHNELEKEIYDSVGNKFNKKLGSIYGSHEVAIMDSIDKKKKELKKSFGYTGQIYYEHIPEWAKDYIEDYIKNAILDLCVLSRDV